MNLADIAVAATGTGWYTNAGPPLGMLRRDEVDPEGFAHAHGHTGCIHMMSHPLHATAEAIVVLATDTTVEENNPGDPRFEGDNRIDPAVEVTAVVFFTSTTEGPTATAYAHEVLAPMFTLTKELTR